MKTGIILTSILCGLALIGCTAADGVLTTSNVSSSQGHSSYVYSYGQSSSTQLSSSSHGSQSSMAYSSVTAGSSASMTGVACSYPQYYCITGLPASSCQSPSQVVTTCPSGSVSSCSQTTSGISYTIYIYNSSFNMLCSSSSSGG